MNRSPWTGLRDLIGPNSIGILEEVARRLLTDYGTASAVEHTLTQELTQLAKGAAVEPEVVRKAVHKALKMGFSTAIEELACQPGLKEIVRQTLEGYQSGSFLKTLEARVSQWIDDLAIREDTGVPDPDLARRTKSLTPLVFMSLGFRMDQGLRAKM